MKEHFEGTGDTFHDHAHAGGGGDGEKTEEQKAAEKMAEIEALSKIPDVDVPDPSLGERPDWAKGDDFTPPTYASGRGRYRGFDDGFRGCVTFVLAIPR